MISDALEESLEHEDGLFLGACYRAESFLASWHDTKLFGRPVGELTTVSGVNALRSK